MVQSSSSDNGLFITQLGTTNVAGGTQSSEISGTINILQDGTSNMAGGTQALGVGNNQSTT
ncbi:hypothetical protein BTJ40_14435 [Microbulbifer sp. A4B17]|nr:hypothetical protein BTJ40_14435 [Microbulbifer sp. A4B17]